MKKFLIFLIFFALSTSTVFGDVIKACSKNHFNEQNNWYRWDARSDKPYGQIVEVALHIAKKMNVELEILRRDTFNDCFQLARTGEVDFLLQIIDKDDRREYMELFEIVERDNGIKGYVGLSKKSKFISKIDDFKNAIPRGKEYQKIIDRKYESIADNSWDTYRVTQSVKQNATQSAKKNQKVCENPPRGTLTSALCFLVEKHTTVRTPITKLDSVDEKNCTFRSQGQTIYLNKVDTKNIQYQMRDGFICWILNGQNITSGGLSRNRYAVCGQNIKDTARLDKAFGAIYGKYCTGVDEEF